MRTTLIVFGLYIEALVIGVVSLITLIAQLSKYGECSSIPLVGLVFALLLYVIGYVVRTLDEEEPEIGKEIHPCKSQCNSEESKE
jgi:hypothetical protein